MKFETIEVNFLQFLEETRNATKKAWHKPRPNFNGANEEQFEERIKKPFVFSEVPETVFELESNVVGVLPNVVNYISGLPDNMFNFVTLEEPKNIVNINCYISVNVEVPLNRIAEKFKNLTALYLSQINPNTLLTFTLYIGSHSIFDKRNEGNKVNGNYLLKLNVCSPESRATNEVLNLLTSELIFRYMFLYGGLSLMVKGTKLENCSDLNGYAYNFETFKKFLPKGTIDIMNL